MDSREEPTTKVTSEPFRGFAHLAAGAQFWRADLHIHSFGVSRDVIDARMTVEGIIATALDRQLHVIAITDHNAIDSVGPVLEVAPKAGLTAFPGVEITTGEGHVLVYFAPSAVEAFTTWFGRITFKTDANSDRHTLVPIHEFLGSVEQAGGIAIPAHVGRANTGFLARVSAQIQEAIIGSPSLHAIEVDSPGEGSWYSSADGGDGASRRNEVLKKRTAALGPVAGPRIAKVLFSDAHVLDDIGRDREGNDRVTRIKMSEPGFEAFRTALADPDARIKLEAELPTDYPRIIGVRLLGGFLDNQEIAFSPNLTCLIGGRGSGKSTAIESVRCTCLGEPSSMDGEPNCPDTVQLIYRDEFGQHHFIKRDSDRATYELTEDEAVETSVAIEGYDQDRIASIIRDYRRDPRQLLAFLDQFADLGEVGVELASVYGQLVANAETLQPLRRAPKELESEKKSLEATRLKLKAIQNSSLKGALAWRRRLQRERQARSELESRLDEVERGVDALDIKIDLRGLAAAAEIDDLTKTPSAEILLGKDGKSGLVGMVEALDRDLAIWKANGDSRVGTATTDIAAAIAQWKEREHAIEARVQAVFEDLRAKGVNPNVSEFNRLTAAEAESARLVRLLEVQVAKRLELTKQRKQLLTTCRDAQSKRFQLRAYAMKNLTAQLNAAFDDFKVKLDFSEGEIVDAYSEWVRAAITGRFMRTSRVENLCRTLHPVDLAALARTGNTAKLCALTDDAGSNYFEDADQAGEFASALRQHELADLELIAPDDRPEISLTTRVRGETRKVDFENLSFGQKASILLGALLFSAEQSPLIIDQPEDHLDSQFIARTVVNVLRRVKERRQVIIATHNANITVLGDAEQIVPLHGYQGRGLARDVGSVDAPKTRERACAILEGGEAAYKRRGEMYGFEIKA